MEKKDVGLNGAYVLNPTPIGDNRGWIMESYSKRSMEELGLYYDFVQENHSYSGAMGVLRGLHCQKGEWAQTKLVRCLKGALWDVIVDIRKGSPTYLEWARILLSAENKRELLVPRGFLHGFVTLMDDVELLYLVDNFYCKEADRSIRWNDPEIGVEWCVEMPVMSEKDATAPLLKDSDLDFVYEGDA